MKNIEDVESTEEQEYSDFQMKLQNWKESRPLTASGTTARLPRRPSTAGTSTGATSSDAAQTAPEVLENATGGNSA